MVAIGEVQEEGPALPQVKRVLKPVPSVMTTVIS